MSSARGWNQDLAKRRLVAAEAKVTEKSRDISKLLRSLADSGFWPIVPPYNLEDFDAKFKDMKGSLGELHHATQLLQASLYNVTVQSLRRRGIPVPEEAQLSGGSDGAAGGSRPSKRRRVVDEEDGQDEEDGMQEAVENLTDRMEKLTQIVDELQNDFLQHNDNIIQEYSGVLEDAIDEIRHSIDPTEISLSAATSTALAKLNEEYDLAHSDLDVITTEVVDVYGRIQALEQENVRLQQENAQWKALAETMAAKHEAQEGLLEKIKAETRALNAAITARLAEQPPPPPQPSLEVILESIREPVVRVARQDAERLINHNRASIENLMSRYQSQMQGPVYDKVMRSAQMADLMLAWIKQRDPEGLEPSYPRSSSDARISSPVLCARACACRNFV
ncbi:hypothetical protein OF83DRAFT_663274 [Amylostereum chailletii]|nr:hypothetical protein OF83DRAFT_663274 [Amylostereum chailletii]